MSNDSILYPGYDPDRWVVEHIRYIDNEPVCVGYIDVSMEKEYIAGMMHYPLQSHYNFINTYLYATRDSELYKSQQAVVQSFEQKT